MIHFSHSLVRHLTIDRMLQNWQEKEVTLTDLVIACTEAVKKYFPEDTEKQFSVSLRTIQLDIQNMRSRKKGYSAPIIVYQNKFYRYKKASFSITDTAIKGECSENLQKLIKVLHLYESFSCCGSLKNDLSLLESHLIGVENYEKKRDSSSYKKRETINEREKTYNHEKEALNNGNDLNREESQEYVQLNLF